MKIMGLVVCIFLVGCSRTIDYSRVRVIPATEQCPVEIVETTVVKYKGPWGTSETKDVVVDLGVDNVHVRVGSSSVNMDKLMETMAVALPQILGDLSTLLRLAATAAENSSESMY